MNQNEFMRQQQAAVERMREMNSRAQINKDTTHKMPPVPSFVRLGETSQYQNPYNQKTNTPSAKEQTKNPTPKPSLRLPLPKTRKPRPNVPRNENNAETPPEFPGGVLICPLGP